MSESPINNPNHEKRYLQANIEDLLPRYFEATGDFLSYRVIRSIPIDGHGVAWMEYAGKNFTGYSLHCACDFAEGVGWNTENDGEIMNLDGGEHCLPKETALYLRQREVREEYIDRFDDAAFGDIYKDVFTLRDHIPAIVTDLLERSLTGEFMGSKGAFYYDGHVFPETIVDITEMPYEDLWPILDQMESDKLIRMDGGVIRRYCENVESSEIE